MVSGIVSPFASPVDDVGIGLETVDGEVWFHEADYQGEARIRSSDAGLRAEGTLDVQATGQKAVVTIVEYTYASTRLDGPVLFWRSVHGSGDVTVLELEDVDLQVSGSENGVFQAWSNRSLASAQFDLHVDAPKGAKIFASQESTVLQGHAMQDRHSYRAQSPVFALTHQGSHMDFLYSKNVNWSESRFVSLNAVGGLDLLVEDATITIDHAAGREKFTMRTSPDTLDGVPIASSGEASYAFVTFLDGDLNLDFQDTEAAFLAYDPIWDVNGTVTVPAEEGHLESGDATQRIVDDEVIITGNASLGLHAEGVHDGQQRILSVQTPRLNPTTEEPRIQGGLQSDSDNVTINGRPLIAAAAPISNFPEEVTLVAKILGALLVVWAVGKYALFFVTGMVARDPLKNARRQKIHDFLRHAGMSHLREIQRATGIPLGSLDYHLNILRQGRLITSVESGGYRVYALLSAEFCPDDMERLALLANPTRREIAHALVDHEPLTQRDLRETLGLATRSSISRHLAKLEEAGLVERQGAWRSEFRPSDLLRRWLAHKSRSKGKGFDKVSAYPGISNVTA